MSSKKTQDQMFDSNGWSWNHESYPHVVEIDIHEPFRGFQQVLLERRAAVVQAHVGSEALDPATLGIRARDADDFGATDDL